DLEVVLRSGCGDVIPGREVEQGAVQPAAGELDRGARPARDQLARGGIDRTAVAGGDHPVVAAGRHVRERHRDRPWHANPIRLPLEYLRGLQDSLRLGRLQRDYLQAVARLHAEGATIELRVAVTGRHELLSGTELVDVAEDYVLHRVPVGHRD